MAVREGLVAAATFPKWRAAARKLAVREGFEPSVGFKAYGALAKLCFRPLSHLTGDKRENCHQHAAASILRRNYAVEQRSGGRVLRLVEERAADLQRTRL
jgi:hypothetical protein